MKKILITTISIITVLIISVILSNYTFIKRALSYPDNDITNVDWYEPMVVVKGGNSYSFKRENGDSVKVDKSSLDKISNYCAEHNSSAMLVTRNSKIIFENYWQNADTNTVTNSMSMAKSFAVLLTGIAIDEGFINSEKDYVADYIEEWKSDDRSKIKIEDLLLMQSGLRNENSTSDMTSDLVKMFIGDDIEEAVLNIPAAEDPAQRYEYNNANSQILGLIIERVTGKRYYEYLSEKLWQPLGAKDAEMWRDDNGTVRMFCCFFSSARDWAKVGNLFLYDGFFNGKQIVPSSWIEKSITPSELKSNVGYYLNIIEKDNPKYNVNVEKAIIIHGMERQRVTIIPEFDLVFVRVGDNPSEWDDEFIINTFAEGIEK